VRDAFIIICFDAVRVELFQEPGAQFYIYIEMIVSMVVISSLFTSLLAVICFIDRDWGNWLYFSASTFGIIMTLELRESLIKGVAWWRER